MVVGFYRDALIGDNLVSIPAMYAIKALYPNCTLVVYTNTIGVELYAQYEFIDALFNMDSHSLEEIKTSIDSYHFDFFILTQANRWRCRLLNSTNAKKIIALLSFGTFFRPKFKTIFISRSFDPTPQYARMFALVRKINPQVFDSQISTLDFSPIILRTKPHHKAYIDAFLSPYSNYQHLVMLNPFSRTCSHNLTLEGWLNLARTLASNHPSMLFIIATYEGNPIPIKTQQDLPNLVIFKNDSDLFNLIELTSRLSLLISPSTGNAHIANNLHIPLLGLFSYWDTRLWRGENMKLENFIILPTKKEKMTKKMEQKAIEQTIQKFDELLCKTGI